MQRPSLVHTLLIAGLLLALPTRQALTAPTPQERPNILWLIVEDMSPHFSCYGETSITTPHVDRLAAEGVLFQNAFVTAPICSIARSALITGRYQTSIGTHHHRSGRGELKIQLPPPVTPILDAFQDAGYQTLNLSINEFLRGDQEVRRDPKVRIAKTDYNFEWDQTLYDRVHWTHRAAGQPFFAQVQLRGGKLRGHGNKPRPVGGRHVVHGHPFRIHSDIPEDSLYIVHPLTGSEITYQKVTIPLFTAGHIDTVNTGLKGLEQIKGIYLTGTGNTYHLDVKGVIQSHRTCQVRSRISSVITAVSQDFRLKGIRHPPILLLLKGSRPFVQYRRRSSGRSGPCSSGESADPCSAAAQWPYSDIRPRRFHSPDIETDR